MRTFSRTDNPGHDIACWYVRTSPVRAISWADRPVISLPRHNTRPEVGLCTPAITLNKVVLPDPFGPMMPTILSDWIEISTPANAITPPNSLRSPVIFRSAIFLVVDYHRRCDDRRR